MTDQFQNIVNTSVDIILCFDIIIGSLHTSMHVTVLPRG